MKILHRDFTDGVVVLNPVDLIGMIKNSTRKMAAVVIEGRDIVASTIHGSDHATIASLAGFSGRLYDPETDIGRDSSTLCLTATDTAISLELWVAAEGDEDCPITADRLESLGRRVENHPRLRRLVEGGYGVDISIMDHTGDESWTYCDGRIHGRRPFHP